MRTLPLIHVRPLYAEICPHCSNKNPTAEENLPPEYIDEIRKAFEKTLRELYGNAEPANDILAKSGKMLAKKVAQSYKQVTPDWTTPDAEMLVRLTRDVWQFSAAKNYQQMRDLALLLRDENGKLREFSDFKAEAEKTGMKYNETWMRTEYNFAISASQNAARWTDFEKEADIIPLLQYQTVGDTSVRPEHQILDGVTKRIDDTWWATHFPPNGWGCRCEAIQAVGGVETPKEETPQIHIPPIFRTNLAKQGLIYPKNHPYYNGIPGAEIRKAIAYLPPENTYLAFAKNPDIEINILHGNEEVEGNLKVTNAFIKNFNTFENPIKKIELLPEISERDKEIKKNFLPKGYTQRDDKKNADAVVHFKNGQKWVVDYKYMTGNGSNLKIRIDKAYQQADYAIIMFENDVEISKRKIINILYRKKQEYPDLKGIYVFDKNENLIWGVD